MVRPFYFEKNGYKYTAEMSNNLNLRKDTKWQTLNKK